MRRVLPRHHSRFLHTTSACLDLDLAELRALALGQRKFEYPVLHQGPDMLVVDIRRAASAGLARIQFGRPANQCILLKVRRPLADCQSIVESSRFGTARLSSDAQTRDFF
jgi:hypothetical protein